MKQFLFAMMTLCLAGSARAHVGDRVFPIYELSDADLAAIDLDDGSVDDWFAVVGEPSLTAQDFTADEHFTFYDPADLDFRIWLAWNDATDRLYVAVEKVDDMYVAYADQYPSDPWFADSGVQFLVDGDHGGGKTIYWVDDLPEEERVFQDNKESQYFMVSGEPLGEHGQHVFIMQNGINYKQDWFYSPPFAEGGGGSFSENPIIVVTEFYVTPFDWLVWNDPQATKITDLSAGKVIGFALLMIDYDTPGSTEYQGVYYIPLGGGVYLPASGFVDGVLVGTDGIIPEVSAVENDSWGRIKASFREGEGQRKGR